jgi:hypothetical protein
MTDGRANEDGPEEAAAEAHKHPGDQLEGPPHLPDTLDLKENQLSRVEGVKGLEGHRCDDGTYKRSPKSWLRQGSQR